MYKTFCTAIAMAACSGMAMAESSVTLYGSLDVGLEYQKVTAGTQSEGGSRFAFVTGSSRANRIGLRGTEDLGGGHKAYFVLEGGLDVGTGNSVPSNVLFNRRSIVGLKGHWGELSLGRDYTPAYWTMFDTDFTKSGMYGGAGPTSQIVQLGMIRQSNGVFYLSPSIHGFSTRVLWSDGTQSKDPTKRTNEMVGIAGHYVSGALGSGIFYEQRKVDATSSRAGGTNKYYGITGQYDFGALTVNGGYTRYDPAGPNTLLYGVMDSTWVGFMTPIGTAQLSLTLGHIRTHLEGPGNGKTWLYGLNYLHPISKRTTFFAGIGRSSNNEFSSIALDTGQRAITGAGRGSDINATMIGMRHTF